MTILTLAFMPRESNIDKEAVALLLGFTYSLILLLTLSHVYSAIVPLVTRRKEFGTTWSQVIQELAGMLFALFTMLALPAALAYSFAMMPPFAYLAITLVLAAIHWPATDHVWSLRERLSYLPLIVALFVLGIYGAYYFPSSPAKSLSCWFAIILITGITTSTRPFNTASRINATSPS
jgi:hypothetical protein